MMLLFLVFISFLGTNGPVYYTLYKQRFNRKSSISLHVANNRTSQILFAAGHFIGGIAFLLFSYNYFCVEIGSETLFWLSILGVVIEQVQAFTARMGRFSKIHIVSASLMGVFISSIVLYAPFVIQLSAVALPVYILITVFLMVGGIYAYFKREKFYQAQVVFFFAFYPYLLLLVYGRS